jgi:hypothetical protein
MPSITLNGEPVSSLPKKQFKGNIHPHSIAFQSKIKENMSFSHCSESNSSHHKTLSTNIVPAKPQKMGKRFKPRTHLTKARGWITTKTGKRFKPSGYLGKTNYTKLLREIVWTKRQTWKSKMKENLKPTAHVNTTRNEIMSLKPKNFSRYEVTEDSASSNLDQMSNPPIHDLNNLVLGSNQMEKDHPQIPTVNTTTSFLVIPKNTTRNEISLSKPENLSYNEVIDDTSSPNMNQQAKLLAPMPVHDLNNWVLEKENEDAKIPTIKTTTPILEIPMNTTRNEIMFSKPQNLSHLEVIGDDGSSPNMYQQAKLETPLPIAHDLSNWVWGSKRNKKDDAQIPTVNTTTPFLLIPKNTTRNEISFSKSQNLSHHEVNPADNSSSSTMNQKPKIKVPKAIKDLYYQLKNLTMEDFARMEDIELSVLNRSAEVLDLFSNETSEFTDFVSLLEYGRTLSGIDMVDKYRGQEEHDMALYQEGMTDEEKYQVRLKELKEFRKFPKYVPDNLPSDDDDEDDDDDFMERNAAPRARRLVPKYEQPTKGEWLLHRMEGTVPDGYRKIPIPKTKIQIAENEFYEDDYEHDDYEYVLASEADYEHHEEDDFEYVDEDKYDDDDEDEDERDLRLYNQELQKTKELIANSQRSPNNNNQQIKHHR